MIAQQETAMYSMTGTHVLHIYLYSHSSKLMISPGHVYMQSTHSTLKVFFSFTVYSPYIHIYINELKVKLKTHNAH